MTAILYSSAISDFSKQYLKEIDPNIVAPNPPGTRIRTPQTKPQQVHVRNVVFSIHSADEKSFCQSIDVIIGEKSNCRKTIYERLLFRKFYFHLRTFYHSLTTLFMSYCELAGFYDGHIHTHKQKNLILGIWSLI
jgi:hypothetical protein